MTDREILEKIKDNTSMTNVLLTEGNVYTRVLHDDLKEIHEEMEKRDYNVWNVFDNNNKDYGYNNDFFNFGVLSLIFGFIVGFCLVKSFFDRLPS